MTIFEICSIVIAVASVFIAISSALRERYRNRSQNLHMCYQRMCDIQKNQIDYSPEKLMWFEENPNHEKTKKYQKEATDSQFMIDREFEFSCYLVATKQVELKPFFHLFKRLVAARSLFWASTSQQHKAKNNPYTIAVIKKCEQKGYLPLKGNKELKELDRLTDVFIKERKEFSETPF